MAVGLQTAAGGSVAEIGEASTRALAKLEQVLPKRLRRRLAALRSSIVRLEDRGPRVKMNDVSFLASSCSERKQLTFLYRDFKGAATSRTVEPHRIVHTGARWYLVAWDNDRTDWRTFRIDRVDSVVATGALFTPRSSPGDDVGAYVTRGVAAVAFRVRAKVVLRAPVEAMRERLPPMVGQLEALDDASCVLETGGFSPESLLMWIAGLGVDFEIREPLDLHDHLARVAERLARASALRST